MNRRRRIRKKLVKRYLQQQLANAKIEVWTDGFITQLEFRVATDGLTARALEQEAVRALQHPRGCK